MTWSQLLRSQAAVACDFVTIDTALLRRFYTLFFIDVTTREVILGGITTNPTAAWTVQAARNLLSEGMKALRTPVRTLVANSIAQRWIGSLRRELLDRTIIWNRRQLQRLVVDYIDHYNRHRPHRSLQQRPPSPPPSSSGRASKPTADVIRLPRCDGLVSEYKNVA